MTRRTFLPTVLLIHFAILAVLLFLRPRYPEWDYTFLLLGNGVLAGVTLLSYAVSTQPKSNRPEAFVRGVYSGMLLKLFLLAGGMLVYILLEQEHLHKPSLAVIGGLYILYTALETAALQHQAQQPRR